MPCSLATALPSPLPFNKLGVEAVLYVRLSMSAETLVFGFLIPKLPLRASPFSLPRDGEDDAVEYLLSIPVFRTLGGWGKLAMLTDRRTSLSARGSPPWPVVNAVEVERSVGMSGLDVE